MSIYDELKIDWAGSNVERTVGLATFRLYDLPDFGLYTSTRDTEDAGELGQFYVGVEHPTPREVAFLIEGEVLARDPPVTDPVERYRLMKEAWATLRADYSPARGTQELGVTVKDLAGTTYRRHLLARCKEEPSLRMVKEGGPEALGLRPAGRLRWLARFTANWPYFLGDGNFTAIDSAAQSVYLLTNPGERSVGWHLNITTILPPTPNSIMLTFSNGARVNIVPRGELGSTTGWHFPFDWFYTDPQDWTSAKRAALTQEIAEYGVWQAGQGTNTGLIPPDSAIAGANTVTLVPDQGTVYGMLTWRAHYRDIS